MTTNNFNESLEKTKQNKTKQKTLEKQKIPPIPQATNLLNLYKNSQNTIIILMITQVMKIKF